MKRALALLLVLAGPVACMDPVHDDAVKALGPEMGGVPPGPLHRPGQPCLTCHGGDGPADSEFSLAGTVYLTQYEHVQAPNVTVVIEDVDGVAGTVTTNEAGSFWVNADKWRPKYPLSLSVKYGIITSRMNTSVGRAGSCADCHDEKTGPTSTSPGHIYVAVNNAQLQKAMLAP
jgi:hypothetical protein